MLSFLLWTLLLNLVDAQVEEDLNAVDHPENVYQWRVVACSTWDLGILVLEDEDADRWQAD